MDKKEVIFRVEVDLLKEFDEKWRRKGIGNRAEAIRQLIHSYVRGS